MGDWVITPENVRAPSGAPVFVKLCAQNIGPGNYVWDVNANYIDLANAANANAARVSGFTVGQGYTGQPIPLISSGTAAFGNAALATGHALVLSPNAGLACNHGDLGTNHYVTKLGWANNASTVTHSIEVTGLQRA